MEKDIFERKLETRDYSLVYLTDHYVVYRMATFAKKDYTIESTNIDKKPIEINISRFVPNGFTQNKNQIYDEELVVTASCKDQEELIAFLDKIKNLENGSVEEPFAYILSETNMTFVKKKDKWIRK